MYYCRKFSHEDNIVPKSVSSSTQNEPEVVSLGDFKPKVIIRTSIGSKKPLDGGVQHTQDYSKVFKNILTEIDVFVLKKPKDIFKTFKNAYERKDSKSSLIIEYGDYYNKN